VCLKKTKGVKKKSKKSFKCAIKKKGPKTKVSPSNLISPLLPLLVFNFMISFPDKGIYKQQNMRKTWKGET